MKKPKTSFDRIKAHTTKAKKRRDQQRAYWLKYQSVRRERYQNDPDYRAKLVEQERERYRQKNSGFEPNEFGANAGRARDFASSLKVETVDGRIITMAVLTITNLAEFLNTTYKVICSWIKTEKFPEPNKLSKCHKRIYTVAEANALSAIFKKSMKGRAALRPTDDDVIEALHDAFQQLQD